MTRRLYYDDAARLEFSARVLELRPLEGGRAGVVLDATFFYPTSGGQMHDTGRLGEGRVEDVVDEGERIVHVLSGPLPEVGATVSGRIDAERRRHHRQQHTGQHVLSRVLEDHYGWPTLSSRLGETMNTLEIEASSVGPELLAEIEDRTNRVIQEGRPVRVHYLAEDEAAAAGLRKKVDREGPVRVVEVEDLDRCPCGGTHVDNTAAIGVVALLGTEKMRGGTRIQFLCGERAVRWRRERVEWLDRTARRLTTGQDLVEETVSRLQESDRERGKRMAAMAEELVRLRAREWRAEAEDFGPFRAVLRVLDEDEALAAATAAHAAAEGERCFAVVLVTEEGKCQVLAAASEELDAADLLRRVLGRFGGRGGGRPGFARGGCTEVEAAGLLDAFREELRSEAEGRG